MDLPSQLGRFRLSRLLGTGGQGRVIEALQRLPGGGERRVAVKLLLSEEDDLRREARLAALLRHPHLVDVYEVGCFDGTWACAMELCPGGSLDGRAPLPLRAVVEVGLQVCDALTYAWQELGLVHLDLKPANLLVRDGAVKVADLGIATARGFEGDGRIRGTPRFMPPEQRLGLEVDTRADVFALGMVLAELAGAPTSAAETLVGPASVEVSAAAVLPDGLAEVVRRCTEPEAADRYPDMAALAEALRAIPVDGPGLLETLGPDEELPAPSGGVAPPWVGRAALAEEVRQALREHRLVTLKGPAGIGKSALARRLAGEDGVVVELSTCLDRDELVGRVAQALSVPLARVADPAARVGDALAERGALLLVLDGLERLLDHAVLLADWVRRAPGVRLLATSRVALGVAGERVLEVPPLPADEAVALVVAHARRRGVELDADVVVDEIVRRLDGVPLALELAAHRLGVLSAADVLERLDLSLLRSGASGLPERQATLRGALDWSWALLGDEERAVLARLSVFAGSFSPDDAARVAEPGADELQALADHSLLAVADGRLRLLGPVASYAAERLEERGETAARELSHARWYARHGHPDALGAGGPAGERAWRQRALDLAELSAAARRAARAGEPVLAERCALAAASVLRLRGPVAQGVALLEEVVSTVGAGSPELWVAHAQLALDDGRIAEAETSVRRAEGLPRGVDATIALDLASADLARARSDVAGAEAHQRRALERCRAHGRPTGRAWLGLCASFLDRGDLSGAGEAGRAAVEALRHTGDAALTIALSNLAVAVRRSGRPAEARALLLEAEAVDRRVGAVANLASDLANLAILDAHEGHLEASLATFQASIDGFLACGMRGAGAQQRSNLAEVSLILGRVEEARRCAELALEMHEELGQHRLIGHSLQQLATLATADGATDEARALLVRSRGHHERARSPGVALVDLELAFLALREGRLDEATALAEAAVSALEGHAADRALALAARGEARAAAGHPGARADLDEAVATLRRVSPTSAPRALCALARATRDPSVLDAAERDPDTWTVRQGSPMAQEVARTRRLLGGATVRG